MKIAVDFDGTVVSNSYPYMGKDVPNAVETLKKFANSGHKIILHTMRSGNELDDAVMWYKKRNIPLYGINIDPEQKSWTKSPKVNADVYIDDKAYGVPLTSFERDVCVDWASIDKNLMSWIRAKRMGNKKSQFF